MPASSTFQSKYLTPGGANTISGGDRYAVAGALYRLQEQLRMGSSPAAAQAHVNQGRTARVLAGATFATLAGQALVTDFAAIDSL
jgi:hypothetical protein